MRSAGQGQLVIVQVPVQGPAVSRLWQQRKWKLLSLVVACCWTLFSTMAKGEPPSFSRLVPAGGQRGSTVVTQCLGEFTWPVKVWAPGVHVRVAEEKRKLSISIPNDLAADRVWIRLFNDDGASAARPFLIGGLKEVDEQEPNDASKSAQEVSSDGPSKMGAKVTINGVLQKRGDVDTFAVRLAAGQTLVAALDANTRLGSPIDAVLQLATPAGTVLAENHDEVGLDPRLVYTASKHGDYLVRLFAFPSTPGTNISYHGGDDCIYRLTVTTGPFMTHTLPMSVSYVKPAEVQPVGWNIPPNLRLKVVPFGGIRQAAYREHEVPSARETSRTRLGFAFAAEIAGAARVRLTPSFVYDSSTDTAEQEPFELSVPSVFSGQLKPRRIESFKIPLQKDQIVRIAVQSHGFHLPLVPRVRLTDPKDSKVAESGESGPAKDAFIEHKAAGDGDYLLTIGDRYRYGGQRYLYQLTVTLAEADFEMSVEADSLVVSPDKPAELPVTIQRSAVSGSSIGPITIQAIDLPPWVKSDAVVSEKEGETAKNVTVKFTTTGFPYAGPIRIRGIAEQPKAMHRFVFTPSNLGMRLDHIWLTATPAIEVEENKED